MNPFFVLPLLLVAALPIHAESLVDSSRGLSAEIPEGWTLYQKGQSEAPDRFIYDFGMPKIWSKIENQDIENAVAIMILDQPCASLAELNAVQEKWTGDRLISREGLITNLSDKAKKEVANIRGLKYTARIDLFERNKTGYIIIFTATKGTYEQNLPRYLEFLKSVKVKGRSDETAPPSAK